MNDFKKKYKRLPGRTRPAFSLFSSTPQQLYIAEDHLLVVNPAAYSEESYRIALDDVQCIALMRTNNWIITNIVMAIAALVYPVSLFSFVSELGPGDVPTFLVLGIFLSGPFLIVLLANLISGPTCTTILRTAVRQHDLTCLLRVRAARKAIAMISAAVEARQGNFAPETEEE